jgi:hypothetical protein
MKLNKQEELIKQSLFNICWINNLESNDIIETIKMIKEKGYEDELIHEINIDCDETIKLLNRISLRNHIQRRYEVIVDNELNLLINILIKK